MRGWATWEFYQATVLGKQLVYFETINTKIAHVRKRKLKGHGKLSESFTYAIVG